MKGMGESRKNLVKQLNKNNKKQDQGIKCGLISDASTWEISSEKEKEKRVSDQSARDIQ